MMIPKRRLLTLIIIIIIIIVIIIIIIIIIIIHCSWFGLKSTPLNQRPPVVGKGGSMLCK